MTISQRDRRALWLGGFGLGLLVVYFLAVEPLWAWYADLASSHQSAAADLSRLISNNRKADYYAARVAEMEERVGPLTEPKPYSEQISVVTERLTATAQGNGIDLKGATPVAPVAWPDDPRLQRAAILVDAEAEWTNALKFIDALYRVEGILSVEQFELSGDAKKGNKLTLKLVVSLLAQAGQEGASPWSR